MKDNRHDIIFSSMRSTYQAFDRSFVTRKPQQHTKQKKTVIRIDIIKNLTSFQLPITQIASVRTQYTG